MLLMIEHTGAAHAYLFTVQPEGLRPMAGSRSDTPDRELSELLQRHLQRELNAVTQMLAVGQVDDSSDEDRFELRDGSVYYPVPLRSVSDEGERVLGYAVLNMDPPAPPRLPWRVVEAISDYLLEAGDMDSMLVAI
jgi:hypothetical protein